MRKSKEDQRLKKIDVFHKMIRANKQILHTLVNYKVTY